MRIFKTKAVARFAKTERIADAVLIEAIAKAERGLIDADLGGGLLKLRIARPGAGSRGGYRLLVGYRIGDRALFMFGFAKNDIGNLSDQSVAYFRAIGQKFMAADAVDIEQQIKDGNITEVPNG